MNVFVNATVFVRLSTELGRRPTVAKPTSVISKIIVDGQGRRRQELEWQELQWQELEWQEPRSHHLVVALALLVALPLSAPAIHSPCSRSGAAAADRHAAVALVVGELLPLALALALAQSAAVAADDRSRWWPDVGAAAAGPAAPAAARLAANWSTAVADFGGSVGRELARYSSADFNVRFQCGMLECHPFGCLYWVSVCSARSGAAYPTTRKLILRLNAIEHFQCEIPMDFRFTLSFCVIQK